MHFLAITFHVQGAQECARQSIDLQDNGSKSLTRCMYVGRERGVAPHYKPTSYDIITSQG